ncbi:DUF3086 domain-containing protein [Chamaesiphon sp. OTE_8_metabat_110]|uniref:DUF3086 domain-containing protein n=1 Tax=Chamaesiphon sp. OTE_8_metabat_110 TaxID=2964696 RepID=UPI00286A2379|nr:DUF3086 domain-containing protein [Chamaesiphon sp. OTE_8_metabat_110]
MNSDGTAKQKPDRQSSPRSDIIDVRVVEQISSASEPLGDVWDSGEVTERSTSSSPPTQTQPPITIPVEPPQETIDPPQSEDNWHHLLDEIDRDLEPPDLEPAVATEPIAADAVPLNLTSVPPSTPIDPHVLPLVRAEAEIKAEIDRLQATRAALQAQIVETQTTFGQVIQTSISELEQRRQKLQISVEQLERRRDRIQEEIAKSFAGGSQDIAIRLQGFKDYLVGSLQDLVVIAEEIDFPQPPPAQIRIQAPLDRAASGNAPRQPLAPASPSRDSRSQTPQFAEPAFKTTATKVRASIDRYRNAPDYYAPAWQLRRTLEAVHADKVSDWFFSKDGRGAVRTMGSRLQNILVAAAAVSALRELYGDYLRTLVLANLPERLGDWRRGFQDCLGLSKADFGGNGGIILFEDPEALIQKVDRIVANQEMPLIIIDNSENQISLSILQYPLWLAFAPDPDRQLDDYREYR